MNSAARPISMSSPKAARRTPPHDTPISAASTAGWLTRYTSPRSGQRPGVFFEQAPGLVAHLLLDVGVEPGFAQRLLEWLGVGRVEGQPALGHLVDLGLVHDLPVGALGDRGVAEMLMRQLLQIGRQPLPGVGVK